MEEAQGNGKLVLSQKNLRDFPDVSDECELIDVKLAGQYSDNELLSSEAMASVVKLQPWEFR